MEIEEEEDCGASLRPDGPIICTCPGIVSQTARLRGIRCQELFTLAYRRAGEEATFARAVFVRFLDSKTKEQCIPLIVREYCQRIEKLPATPHGEKDSFCLGCTFNKALWQGLVDTYAMIHPDVTEAFLERSAKEKAACPTLSPKEALDLEIDEVFQDLTETGLLDFEDEDWMDLMRRDDQAT